VRRFAFGALSVLAAAAITASVLAFVALRQSQHNEAQAEIRFARGLATQAESLAPTRPKLALALAAESAARVHPIPAEAQQAMATARMALSSSDIVASSEPIPVGDALTTLVTPDGSTVVTGTRDGTVRLWDTRTREPIATLTGPTEGIEEAAVDPDGRWLVAAGADGLWRWDLDSDTTQGELVDRPTGALWSVAFSADGARIATAAEDGVITIYSTSSWEPDGEPLRASIDFLSVAFTLDGRQVLAGTGDGRVVVWDLADRALVGSPIAAHGTNDVWEIVMDPSGQRVATASSDGTARVWSLASGALVATPFVNAQGDRTLDAVAGLVWSQDGGSLFAGGNDGRVHEWELTKQSEVDSSAIGHDDRVIDASASADRTVLATLGRDQDVRLWDTADREPIVTSLDQLDVPLYGVALSDDSAHIAVGDDRGVVHVVSSGGPAIELPGHAGRVFGLAFLPDGRLVSGDDAGSLRLWDPASGRLLATHEQAASGAITSIAVAPTGDLIATSSADGGVQVWKPDDLDDPVAQTPRQNIPATKVAFSASGELVASYGDGEVRFWDRDGAEARPPLVVDDDRDVVFSVAVSPDDRLLAVATATDGVTIWDLDTGEQSSELNGQPIDAVDVSFTPDGTALVSTTRRGVITLWNSVTGQAIGPRFDHHKEAVWRVAVTPSGAVVSAGEDGLLARLDALDLGHACDLGAPSLDRRARDRYLGDREPIGCTD
jgi:WD40 repeat protein